MAMSVERLAVSLPGGGEYRWHRARGVVRLQLPIYSKSVFAGDPPTKLLNTCFVFQRNETHPMKLL
jgi:hypothetical protein